MTSIDAKFRNLLTNLRTKNHSTVVARRREIVKRLNFDFWGSASNSVHSRYIGSYGRGTEIKGASDVDLMFTLPNNLYSQYDNHYGNGQSALLQAVRNSIRVRYPSVSIGGDGQVVVVSFSDEIKFEVLPTFVQGDGSFKYPDSNSGGTWKKVDPISENEAIDSDNRCFDNKIKHLARMTRSWKRKNDVSMSGLLIDTLAYDFMQNWQYNGKSYLYYDFMTRDFLKFLYDQDTSRSYWLAPGSNQRVNRTGSFEYKAGQGYRKAVEALDNESNSYNYLANECWRSIFGSAFSG